MASLNALAAKDSVFDYDVGMKSKPLAASCKICLRHIGDEVVDVVSHEKTTPLIMD